MKTIPFRMITDIKATQGSLDRLFDIGNLNVQIAGMGAQNVAEGVLRELTDFKDRQTELLVRIREYFPRSEALTKAEKIFQSETKIFKEMLNELKEIRKKI